jgi:molecular chaperone GrpE
MNTDETSFEQQRTMTVEDYDAAVADLQQQNEELRDKYLRAAAAIENTRKRADRDATQRANQRLRSLYARLIEVADNLERALSHAKEGDPLRPGVQVTLQQLEAVLRQEGVNRIDVEARMPFDPQIHEAIGMKEGDVDQPTVAEVVQNGYLFDGQVLRPARVTVLVPARENG